MNLFNPKTLARHLENPGEVPSDHLERLQRWAGLIKSGRIFDYKEIELHAEFKAHVVEAVLGYKGPVEDEAFTVASEKAILRGAVDLALGHFSKQKSQIIAPFELKGARTVDLDAIMPGRAKSPVQQAWEYATGAPGVKWVLVSNYLEIRLYGFGAGTQAYERFDLSKLTEPAEYARFRLLLAAENLLSGKTMALLRESRREDKDITDALYADYKTLRGTLIFAIRQQLPGLDPLKAIAAAQTVLDRVLFTAFAEDTGLLPARILEKAFEHADPFNPRPVWDNFKGLFAAIDTGNSRLDVPPYNGGLFAPDPVVDQLQLPDAVCEGFKNLGAYDFASEVSVTVLGHIFEQSISDVERLQAEARGDDVEPEKKSGTSGRRKRDGVVYTPDYVARFIVDQTVGAHLSALFGETLRDHAPKGSDPEYYESIKWRSTRAELRFWEAYRDRLKALRIVDPACGSGVFLVTAFDFMKAEMTRVNDKIAALKGDKAGMHLGDLFDPDSEILTNNLFGVDVNAESIEIAKLSLWIKTARRGKTLDSLDRNLRVGDSLIEDSNFAYLAHGFTWKEAFADVFAEGGFDIVLGNPPYVRMELLKALKPYLEKRFEVVSDRADLYAYFFEQGLKLLKPGGRLGYISSSTFFKTGSGKPLRDLLRREATLETVVDFGDLQIFEGVTTYPAILTLRREPPAKNHEIRFWNVTDLPDSNFRATFAKLSETYPQAGLSSGSWELESPALKALRDKIRTGKPTLKEVYGSPCRGVVTGLNEAFVIDTPTKARLCAEDPKSAELLKPLLKGNELSRWCVKSRGNWIIYIPKNRVTISNYPAIRDWLHGFRPKLERRATQQEWYELQQAQEAYIPAFEKTKISYIEVCNKGPFSFEKNGFYQEATTFFISSSDISLLALLNSNVAWFFFTGTTTVFRGGYFRMKNQFVELLPIPNWCDAAKGQLTSHAQACQSAAEARYRLEQGLARRLPDLAPAGTEPKLSNRLKEWWLLPDFAAFRAEVKKCFKADIPLSERSDWEDWIARAGAEIARLSAEIAAHEKKINEIVYRLFDLTPDEIALLEANL